MTYLYRGVSTDRVSDILAGKEIRGGTHTIYETDLAVPDAADYTDEPLSEIPTDDIETWEAPVTGGVSHVIQSTSRFRGNRGTVVVLDGDRLPFERAQYDYDFWDDHPGYLAHILTSSQGELRLDRDPSLWAIVEEKGRAGAPDYLAADHWGPENIPATSSNSAFAQEAEWMAPQESVDVAGAVEGVVAIKDEFSVRMSTRDDLDHDISLEEAVPRYWDGLLAETGAPGVPMYLLAVDDHPDQGGYDHRNVEMAYGSGGFLDPDDVPAKFRGVP